MRLYCVSSSLNQFSVTKSKFWLCILDWAHLYRWWGEVSLFGHYMVAAKWLLPQAFSEYHEPHHKHSSHGMSQRSTTLLALLNLHCGMQYLVHFFCFHIGLQTHQRSKLFFSVVIQMCFQYISLDAAGRYVRKWNHASTNLISLLDSHALYLNSRREDKLFWTEW
jgi:hypothetical protein